jgi:FkbM family methyltransferase
MFGASRAMLRRLTLAWGRTGRAPGWYFHAIERWGALASDGWLPRRLVNGCEVRCDLSQYIDRHIFFIGLYEPVELYLMMQMLEAGQTVVDGGANIGLYSIMMSTAVGEGGSVHAFEPVPKTHALLVENIGRNRLTNVTVSNAALSDEPGVVSLGLAVDQTANSGAFGVGHQTPATAVDVSTITLDEYAAGHNLRRIDFVKLDVEGSELRALHGMRTILERDEPTLLVEVCQETAQRAGFVANDILDLLGPLGYRAFVIAESSERSHYADSLDDLHQANVLFHTGPTPSALEQPWNLKQVLHWARMPGRS